ncbi:MAG: hypothetical protein N2253_05380 [Bacteroidia bacterium]|nr:hypothetical protein [Bacteroidia bacterium]MDW8057473.1 hypothetical protein [Bacteroidia bacterium]
MRWLVGLLTLSWAQQSIRDSAIHFFFPTVMYQGMFPLADMAKRFGYSSAISAEVAYKLRSGLYLALQGGGLIGDKIVEEGFLESLSLPSFRKVGLLAFIDENGKVFTPALRQRGWTANFRIGYILSAFRLPGQNPNCGPFIEVGGGYLSHRILIDKARSERLPLLEGEYLKGLDRLTGGWGIMQSIGYRFFSSNGLINFVVGLEGGQYFTRSLRGYVYDKGERDTARRRDFFWGFRVGWSLPLYEKAPLE